MSAPSTLLYGQSRGHAEPPSPTTSWRSCATGANWRAGTRSANSCFDQVIDDPRRRQGRRHALPTVLALATAATLCGMRGYQAIREWVDDLSPRVLERFRVRRRNGQHRALATHFLGRGAHYLFIAKGNQPTPERDIRLLLEEAVARRAPDFTDESPIPEHGRRERRSIWVSSKLNE